MKKIVLITIIIGGLLTGVFLSKEFIGSKKQSTATRISEAPLLTSTLAPTDTPHPISAIPTKLSIPKLNVKTSVESVAQDSKGNMDVPKDADNVAWYNLGPKPGEQGSAVLAGHFDDPSGDPAVFYNLDSLEEGDELEVSDENGTKYIYVVTKKESYPVDSFPVSKVFGPADNPMLNLITCAGVWNESATTYSNRLVVFSELKEIKKI